MRKGKLLRKLKRKSPLLLCVLASVGVVGTAVSSAKRTPLAIKVREEAEQNGFGKVETIAAVAPVYAPTLAIGAGTIACIFGAHYLDSKQQASLISAYKLVETSYNDYKRRVIEKFGDSVKEIDMDIAKEKYKECPKEELSDEIPLFYDTFTGEYFNACRELVLGGLYNINRRLAIHGRVTFNDFRRELNLKPIDGGDIIGWDACEDDPWSHFGYVWIDVEFEKMELELEEYENGLECYAICYSTPAVELLED